MGNYSLGKTLQAITIALSPLYILRAHFLIPTTLLEGLLITTILATAFEFLSNKGKLKDLRTKFDPLILFFLLAAFIATLVTPDVVGGLGILKAYFIEPVLFFYCLVYTSRRKGSGYIVSALIVASVWLSALAILQKITHQFSLAPYELAQGRVSAVYNSANSLALFLGPVSLIAFSQFIQKRNTQKLLYLGVFLLLTAVIIMTRSRGGMVAELIGLVVFLYAVLAKKHLMLKKYWLILPVAIFAGIALFLASFFKTYYLLPAQVESPNLVSDTLKIRYYIWAGTINMIRDHPFFGAGLDGFKNLYTQKYHLPQYKEEFQYPHNLILTFWTETGLLGLASFLLILVSAFSLLIRNLFKNPVYIAGLLGALSYLVVHGMVDVPYFKNDLSVQFWTLIALVLLHSS
jgi:putative inorganic carbon (hco3(-)) transporter